MKRNQNSIFTTRRLVLMAVLIAIQIVLARYLSLQVSATLRISFETIPLALAGMWLGPVGGVIVALVSDILGTIIYGYGVWFPPIAIGPAFFAAMCGWGVKYVFRSNLAESRDAWKVVAWTALAGFINAFLIGVPTTTLYYMIIVGKEGTFTALAWINFLERLSSKPLVVLACAGLVAIIHRSVYRPVISGIVRRGTYLNK